MPQPLPHQVPKRCRSSSADEIKASNVSFRQSSCSEATAKPLITSMVWGIKGPELSELIFLTTRKGSGSNRVLTGFSTAVYSRSRLCILSFLSLPCWRLLLFLPCKTGLDNAPGMQLLFHPFGQQQRAHGHNTHVPLRETDPKASRPLLLNPPPQSEKVGWGK